MKLTADSIPAERIQVSGQFTIPEILVIDDDPAFQKLLEKSFSPTMTVASALSGQGGLDLIADPERSFSCVLLDYQLPGANGVTVLKHIRELDRSIPIIFMTGFGDFDLVQQALQLGANEYFPKPAQPEALFQAISKWAPGIPKNLRFSPPPAQHSPPGFDSGNLFTAQKVDGGTLDGKIVRFGTQSVIVEIRENPDELPLGGIDLEEIEMELGKFSMSVDSAAVQDGHVSLSNTVEISLSGHWHVECQNGGDDIRPVFNRAGMNATQMPGGLKSAVSDLVALFNEMHEDLDALENHIEEWAEHERASIEQSFITQMEHDYFPPLDAAMARFEKEAGRISPDLDAAIAPQIRDALYPLVLASPFMSRVIEKPIGVPGDFGMLGQILGNPFEGHNLYARTINGWILRTGAARAYRYRVDLLSHHLETTVRWANREGRRARVLSIGSGVAYEVQRYIKNFGDTQVDFQLLDFSPETLQEANRLIDLCVADSKTEGVNVDICQGSVLDLISNSRAGGINFEGVKDFDFVYCTGLFDYLPDRLCREITGYLTRLARPEGKIAVSNFTPKNPIRRFMDLVLDWQLIYRTPEHFEQLVDQTESASGNWYSVFEEPGGVEVYSIIGKG